jgi:hypothetical protein
MWASSELDTGFFAQLPGDSRRLPQFERRDFKIDALGKGLGSRQANANAIPAHVPDLARQIDPASKMDPCFPENPMSGRTTSVNHGMLQFKSWHLYQLHQHFRRPFAVKPNR